MNLKNRLATVAAASIFALSMGTAAYAESHTGKVTQEITAGTITYSIVGTDLETVRYSEIDTTSSGTLQLQVNGHGNLDGWTLTVQASSPFVYNGDSKNGEDLPADHLSLTTANAPVYVAGQQVDSTHGPKAVAAGGSGSLGSPVSVITSSAGYGSGSYTQDLDVSLMIPAYSQAGTYSGEVTVSTGSAPGMDD